VDSTIEGIVNTELNRVASAIAQGIANGWSPKQTAAAIDQIINDEKRAWLIAETEYANAMVAASRATYLANNVQMLQWYSQPDACSACEENQQASPIRIDQSWPNGNPLVHPHCRCAEGPYITVGGV